MWKTGNEESDMFENVKGEIALLDGQRGVVLVSEEAPRPERKCYVFAVHQSQISWVCCS
jgi:hypothetical protein